MVDSMVDNTAVSTMEVSRSMVVNNTTVNSRITTTRLSRWSRRACPSCSRCSSAARLCKGVVGLVLCRLTEHDLESWRDLQGRRIWKILIPMGCVNGKCWIGNATTMYIGAGVYLDNLYTTKNGAILVHGLSLEAPRAFGLFRVRKRSSTQIREPCKYCDLMQRQHHHQERMMT
jgi:hypothetical protein